MRRTHLQTINYAMLSFILILNLNSKIFIEFYNFSEDGLNISNLKMAIFYIFHSFCLMTINIHL